LKLFESKNKSYATAKQEAVAQIIDHLINSNKKVKKYLIEIYIREK
jgi:hypothetical protein